MYNMIANRMPAPYETAAPMMDAQFTPRFPTAQPGFSQMQDQQNPTDLSGSMHLSRGGRAHKTRMVIAHMNPRELDILDHLQGKREQCSRTGVRTYKHLEELLKNPHIIESVHHHARQHHAEGGLSSSMDHLREGGRFGDTELASIGPNTHHLFNQLAGHATQNPYTGHPEYFSIGGALSGLWDTLKGFGKKILPHAMDVGRDLLNKNMPAIQKGIGDKFGDVGKKAAGFLPGLSDSVLGKQEGPMNPAAEAISRGINEGVQGYRSGAGARQAFGKGLQAAGQGFGGGAGAAMQGAGASLGQGGGFADSLKKGAQAGFNQMGGMDRMGQMAKNTFGAFQRGGLNAAGQAARGQMQNFAQRAMPQPVHPYADNEDLGDYGRQMFQEG